MPEQGLTARRLAAAAASLRQATEKRDALIRQMRAEGATLRAIAEQAGMTHAGVARVLDR